MRFQLCIAAVAASLTVWLVGCSSEQPEPKITGQSDSAVAGETVNRIYAVSYPLQFLTQQITGPDVEVLLPLQPPSDPRRSRPDRQVVEAMQQADLIITNGTGARYAQWVVMVSLPDSKTVNTASRGLALRDYIAIKGESIVHSHGPEGEHSHPIMAARTWLDPSLAKKQARYIAKRLVEVYPQRSGTFEQNLKQLESRLDGLITQMGELKELAKQKSPRVLVVGKELEFLLKAAGFSAEQLPDLDKQDPASKQRLADAVKTRLAKVGDSGNPDVTRSTIILFSDQNVLGLLSKPLLGVRTEPVKIDSLDWPPQDGDYLEAMKHNIDRIAESLKQIEVSAPLKIQARRASE